MSQIAIVQLGYDFQIAVPVANLSAVLTALDHPRVESKYVDRGEVYFPTDTRRDPPRVTLIDALAPERPADPAPATDTDTDTDTE